MRRFAPPPQLLPVAAWRTPWFDPRSKILHTLKLIQFVKDKIYISIIILEGGGPPPDPMNTGNPRPNVSAAKCAILLSFRMWSRPTPMPSMPSASAYSFTVSPGECPLPVRRARHPSSCCPHSNSDSGWRCRLPGATERRSRQVDSRDGDPRDGDPRDGENREDNARGRKHVYVSLVQHCDTRAPATHRAAPGVGVPLL